MAKVGEGDERWIVQERADGTNVHNWHWQERDLIGWAKQRLGELLANQCLVNGEGNVWIKTTSLDSVTGELVVNTRKGKIIPTYELAVKVKWEGEVKDGDGNTAGSASGILEIPHLADENQDEDPEVKVSTSTESNAAQRCKQTLLSKGKQAVHKAIAQFVQEVQKGGPVQLKSAGEPSTSQKESMNLPKNASETKVPVAPAAKRAPPKTKGRSIELKESFYARPQDLYECFTHPGRIQAFTQSPAVVEPKVNGAFTMFNGSVAGKFVELDPPSRIVQDWRFSNWEEGVHSRVEIKMEEESAGNTTLTLKQTGIPEADRFGNEDVVDTTRNGWQSQIFHKIRAVFGYGL